MKGKRTRPFFHTVKSTLTHSKTAKNTQNQPKTRSLNSTFLWCILTRCLFGCLSEGKNILSRVEQAEGLTDLREANHKRLSEKMNLAVALISLGRSLKDNDFLQRTITKIVGLLRAKNFSIRETAIKTLEKITGEDILKAVVETICQNLRDFGFQRHVKIFAVNVVISKLQIEDEESSLKMFKNGHNGQQKSSKIINSLVKVLTNLVDTAVFGKEMEEQKEKGVILSKTPEARGKSKAYTILTAIGKHCSLGSDAWKSVIDFLRNKLFESQKAGEFKVVKMCFESICTGIKENSSVDIKTMLSLVFLMVEDAAKESEPEKEEKIQKQSKYIDKVSTDCFILPETDPNKKLKATPISARKAVLHIYVEFCLNCLYPVIKNTPFKGHPHNLAILNSIIQPLNSLMETTTHVNIISQILRIMMFLLEKCPLPEFHKIETLQRMTINIFGLLKKYGRSDTNAIKTNQGNELSNEIFKTLTLLIEQCPKNEKLLNDVQLRILLGYCEEDLLNIGADYSAFKHYGLDPKFGHFWIFRILFGQKIEIFKID